MFDWIIDNSGALLLGTLVGIAVYCVAFTVGDNVDLARDYWKSRKSRRLTEKDIAARLSREWRENVRTTWR